MEITPIDQWSLTLDQHRGWVRGWIADEETAAQFDRDWPTKLAVICAVAANLKPEDITAWQALGVVFGDALSLSTGLPWAQVTDEYGTDPCLVINAATNAVLFPLTMLSKRAEQGTPPDQPTIRALFDQAVTQARELAGPTSR